MILDRWRLRIGLPALAGTPTPPAVTKHVTVHDVDGDRWASCTRCTWTSGADRDLAAQAARHQTVACGTVAR